MQKWSQNWLRERLSETGGPHQLRLLADDGGSLYVATYADMENQLIREAQPDEAHTIQQLLNDGSLVRSGMFSLVSKSDIVRFKGQQNAHDPEDALHLEELMPPPYQRPDRRLTSTPIESALPASNGPLTTDTAITKPDIQVLNGRWEPCAAESAMRTCDVTVQNAQLYSRLA